MNMTVTELKNKIKSGDVGGAYVFAGEEDYLKKYYLSEIANICCPDEAFSLFNRVTFDGADIDLAEIAEAIKAPPMMSDLKLIEWKYPDLDKMKESDKKTLIAIAESLTDYPYITFVLFSDIDGFDPGTVKRPSKNAKLFSKTFNIVNFEYVAELMLGATTPSYDMEHPVDKTYPTDHITREKVEEAVLSLTGERLQAPPIYSAKKVEGLRAYELARAGEQVELRKALINIYSIKLEEFDMPKVRIRVECSKGTYIRSLAQEIGEKLDSGAYLTMLRRTRNGAFSEKDAISLDDFLKNLPIDETKE